MVEGRRVWPLQIRAAVQQLPADLHLVADIVLGENVGAERGQDVVGRDRCRTELVVDSFDARTEHAANLEIVGPSECVVEREHRIRRGWLEVRPRQRLNLGLGPLLSVGIRPVVRD